MTEFASLSPHQRDPSRSYTGGHTRLLPPSNGFSYGTGVQRIGLFVLAIGVILILGGLLREANDSHDVFGSIMREAGVVVVGTVLVTFLLESVLRRDHDQHVYRQRAREEKTARMPADADRWSGALRASQTPFSRLQHVIP
jgi:hypothetical protein